VNQNPLSGNTRFKGHRTQLEWTLRVICGEMKELSHRSTNLTTVYSLRC